MKSRRVHRRVAIKGEKYETHEPQRKRDKKIQMTRRSERESTREGGRAMSDDLSIDHLDYWMG